MASDPMQSLEFERLTREEPFVRALARALVADGADDVVQQTYLQALRADQRGVRSLRGWLARTVRNVAHNFQRGDRRRRDAEPHAEARERVPTASEIIEREERRIAVVRAIDRLDANLRSLVLLRYFEGLPPAQIARELGWPVTRVWNGLRRALVLLRAELEREHGDRRAWLAPLLLPLSVGRAVPAPAGFATGAILMTTTTKILSLAGVVAAAALAIAMLWSGSPAKPEPTPIPGTEAPPMARGTVAESVATDPIPVPRAEVVTPDATAVTTGTLAVRVVYGDAATPLAGVGVYVRHRGMADRRYGMPHAVTDADGRATFTALPAGLCSVQTNRRSLMDAHPDATVVAGETTDLVIEISTGVDISGVVVDGNDVPVAGADVYLAPLAMIGVDAEVVAVSDGDGRFELLGCSRVTLIGARGLGYGQAPIRVVHASLGSKVDVRLQLGASAGAVAGRVTTADGTPVADAFVRVGDGQVEGLFGRADGIAIPAQVRTRSDGSFVALGVEPGEQPVQVRAPGRSVWQGRCFVVAGVTTGLDVTLAAGVSVSGKVIGIDGAPVKGAEVRAGERGSLGYFETYTAADGTFRFAGLPAGVIALEAEAENRGKASVELHASAGEALHWEAQLALGVVLNGRIIDEAGEPVAGAWLHVSTDEGGGEWSGQAESDQDGRFSIGNCPDRGTLRLTVEGEFLRKEIEDVDPRAGELTVRVVRAAKRSVRITGRVLAPDGSIPVDARITAVSSDDGASGGNHDCDPKTGAFELSLQRPGELAVNVRAEGYPGYRTPWRQLVANESWDVGVIQLVQGGQVRVDLSGDAGERFRLVVLDASLEWVTDVNRRVDPMVSPPLAPGSYTLRVTGPEVAAQVVPFAVRAGATTRLSVDSAIGYERVFEIEVPSAAGRRPVVHVSVRDGSGKSVYDYSPFMRDGKPGIVRCGLAPGEFMVIATSEGRAAKKVFQVDARTDPQPIRLRIE